MFRPLLLSAVLAAALALPAHAGILYAIADSTNSLVTIDRTTGAVTVVGSTGVGTGDFGDLAYDSNTGTMYWSAGRGNNGIYRINTTTGAATLIGNTGVGDLFGLAFDTTNNILFGRANDGHALYTISTTTAAATTVGPNSVFNGALEYRADTDTLYALSAGGGDLLSVNRGTGASTLVAATIGGVNNSDIAWDADLNAWWVVDWSRRIYRYSADFSTRTLVSSAGEPLDGVVYVGSAPVGTPEPASLAILGIGLLGLRLARRR